MLNNTMAAKRRSNKKRYILSALIIALMFGIMGGAMSQSDNKVSAFNDVSISIEHNIISWEYSNPSSQDWFCLIFIPGFDSDYLSDENYGLSAPYTQIYLNYSYVTSNNGLSLVNPASGSGFGSSNLIPGEDYTVYVYNENSFDPRGARRSNRVNWTYPIPVELPADPTAEGYSFAGWYYDNNFETPYAGEQIYSDTTLYAGWHIDQTPVQEHFNFVGWYLDEDFITSADNVIVSLDTPIYPKFENKKYTVNFVASPLIVNSITLNSLTEFTPDILERTGYYFKGWFLDAEYTQEWVNGAPLTEPLTLYAKWEIITYMVTFYVGDNVYTTLTVSYGATLGRVQEQMQTMYNQMVEFYKEPDRAVEVDYTTPIMSNMSLGISDVDEEKITAPSADFGADLVDWLKINYLYIVIPVGAVIVFAIGFAIVRKKRY